MSSNKTIIPGMEDAYTKQPDFGRQNAPVPDGTYVPNPFGTVHTNAAVPNQKPIVGFLYSISKSSSGEFWPLHIGSNSIGRSSDCDICLGEATVSEQHAVLVVRQMKNPEKIIASICDARSTCGTMINGESLGFDQRECFNGDIITIGEHYDLYFILVDAKQIGLNVCREFMSVQMQSGPFPGAQPNGGTQMYGIGTPSGGTVGFNDSGAGDDRPATNPSGTIFM